MSLADITAAANDLAALLEASAPRHPGRGLKHPKHSVHIAPARKRIKAVIAQYLGRQRAAVLAAVKPHIERQLLLHPPDSRSRLIEAFVSEHAGKPLTSKGIIAAYEASTQGKTFSRTLLPSSLHPLQFSATAGETSEYNEAITELIAAAAKSLGATAGEDLASTYLRENSLSRLTGGLDTTTTERLQGALADAWDAGGSYDQMVAAIEDFDGFSEKRAGLVAATESADAYNSARADTAAALGYDEHSWETESGDPCPVCEENEGQGWIDIDEDFASGDDAPTAHPNCLCVVNFRKSDEDE